MNWLNVQTALIATAIAVPLLVLFYFLKLRRRQLVIGSTMLWLRSVQDLHVNTFFQWLRHNWLLWLQLIILAILLAALADPVLNRRQSRDRKFVLMMDTSASMTATDGGTQTRLERAVADAHRLVDNLNDGDEVMVITFADTPRVLCTFTTFKEDVHAALDERVKAVHTPTSLAAAMQIVDSVTRNANVEPVVYLFTDGRIPDAAESILSRGKVNVVNVARGDDNVAVMALSVRRNYQDPTQAAVHAEIRNFAPRPVELDVQLVIRRKVADAVHLKLGPHEPTRGGEESDRRILRFDVKGAAAGVYRVRIARSDHLAADNSAAVILPPAKRARGLLVTRGNYFLEPMMNVLSTGTAGPLAETKKVTPQQFESAEAAHEKRPI